MTNRTQLALHIAVIGLVAASVAGCNWGGGNGDNLSAQRFTDTRGTTDRIAAPIDEPGPLLYDQVRVDVMQRDPRVAVGTTAEPEQPTVREVSPVVREGLARRESSPTTQSAPNDTTAVTQTPASEEGQYFTLGGVVAEVNGEPIFANRVINILARPLQAMARQHDRRRFEQVAREMILRQIRELIQVELRYAAARRNLSADEQLLADSMTMAWRNRVMTQAGGSLEQAIAEAARNGEDFEQTLAEQNRNFVVQVFSQKKLRPRIQVSADDLRRYYDIHLKDEFTKLDEVQFRLIKIDPARRQGRDAAEDRIQTMRVQAAGGEVAFETLASQINDDAYLAPRAGDVGTIRRGDYAALPKVEQTVWDTPVGEVTPVVEEKGAFYIAKVEKKDFGRVMAFEEEGVQDRIRARLEADQFRQLLEESDQRLRDQAAVRFEPQMAEIAVDMALQSYPRWSRRPEPPAAVSPPPARPEDPLTLPPTAPTEDATPPAPAPAPAPMPDLNK